MVSLISLKEGVTLKTIREENPLIHCMTNLVVTNVTANGLLAIGASPVMAYAKEETADMASVADGLLLNIGTPSKTVIEAMIVAGKAANEHGKPVILDPVGAGATPFRNQMIKNILDQVEVSLIRGNAGEIAAILGQAGTVKGVDAQIKTDPIQLAIKAANQLNCIIVVTGATDVVSDGSRTVTVNNGHPWLTKVVGTGCLLGGVICAYSAVRPNALIDAATQALVFYGVAAERAFAKTQTEGIASFQIQFINELSQLTEEEATLFKQVEEIE